MLWFTSDTHFGHANIIKYCDRPYSTVEEMDEALIRNWNEVVKPEDEIFHLGDVTFYRDIEKIRSIMRRLNGRKHLIWGNHDKTIYQQEIRSNLFDSYQYYYELREPKYPMMVLCHYPLLTWNKAHHSSFMLHGHCHGGVDRINKDTTRMDVGVDSNGQYPISINQVVKILSQREYKTVDYHGNADEM